jgi:hypothetical protein
MKSTPGGSAQKSGEPGYALTRTDAQAIRLGCCWRFLTPILTPMRMDLGGFGGIGLTLKR